ncbi:ABC transporter permease [Slackia isoflavoniconvertens]|uniref:ABC transporter permease n=1 Tax=Slackia isoflavoniconvertens TaxID=572010 RepID=A0A3N0IL51_9ACTN|nr:ABC transporter permease [Slackia isoflavoniconvertens]MBB3279241.1 putative ABC transport system permease protein [Slackia isoflavoniconvertens]RNM37022.1 ABC transporter permease [Slackia isoflavoniconvertens]
MASAFGKDLRRSITHSWGRFLAIAIIAALGAGFYAGLRMTGPDMRLAGDEYYDGTSLADVRVVSTIGFDEAQIDALRDVEGVSAVMPAREADAISELDGVQYTLCFQSLDVDAAQASTCDDGFTVQSSDGSYLNRPILKSGTWPTKSDECLLSSDTVWQTDVHIGDKVRLIEGTQDLDDSFAEREFTVVGFVNSSYYTCSTNVGSTSLGSGRLTSFVLAPDSAFADDYPITEAFIAVDGARDLPWASDAYQAKVDEVANRIDAIADDLKASRIEGLQADAQATLDEKRAEYEQKKADALAQLDDGQATLDDSKAQLDSAAVELESAKATIAQSESRLASGRAQYESGVAELADQRSQAQAALAQAQASIDEGWAKYHAAMQTREMLNNKLDEAQKGLDRVNDGLAQVAARIEQAQRAIDELQAQIDALNPADPTHEETKAKKAALEQQLPQAKAALSQLQQQQAQLESQKTEIEAGIVQLQAGIAQIDTETAGVPEQLAAGEQELAAQKAAANQGFASGQASLDAAAAQLAQGQAQLDEGRAQLKSGQAEYADGLSQWENGAAELADKRAQAEAEFADAEAQLADAQAEVDDIATMDADVYALDLKKNIGAESFRSDAGRIDQIAQVFPLLFFLVAALVSLTTMTRMVDEERVLIGTFKALGYSNGRIASKYLVYAMVASGVGSIVGIVLLSQFLPWFIMNAYAIIYVVPCRPTPIDPALFLLAAGLSVGITVAATLFAAMATLREKPAALMLPRAPKAGKRILLERIRPLWSRMSFSWKVTARNLFRYKRRFFMAIIGIAGCTGLLLTGLGLQNAINDIIDKQYGELYHYNAIVRMDPDAADAEKNAVAKRVEADSEGPKAWVLTENKIVRTPGASDEIDQRVELNVPQDTQEFGNFNTLRTRVGHKPLAIDDEGVLISEKLATKLGVSVGDSIAIYDEDAIGNATGEGREVRVSGIMENYVAQYVLMSPALYESTMGEAPSYATLLANVAEGDDVREVFSDEVLAMDGVKTVTYNDETINSYRSMLKSVDSVVVVLVVAAALLAFVVLYNLTNINITERVREIATLKVLGFTPHEVNAYIYRETMLLSLIGAFVGLFLGIAMEGYVVITAEVDQVMFGREIHTLSFAIAFALTMLFSVIVTLAMKFKLKKIDMVESLKSVD